MGAESTIHSRLITAAARNILKPIGISQNGRSRVWLGDHGWWLDVVEFQPSSWAKGSYLNVSCMWLWSVKPYISFDVGEIREADFEGFQNKEQFALVAEKLAATAAARVQQYRAAFSSIQAVSHFYSQEKEPPAVGWPAFHAAVAHGLCGRGDAALDMLAKFFSGMDHSIEWQQNAAMDAQYLASIAQDKNQFRQVIEERVRQTRSLQKLPSVEIIF